MSSVTLAFVDDAGNVTLNLTTDVSLAESFTSSTHIIDVTSIDPQPAKGWTYDGTKFIAPPVPVEPLLTPNVEPPIAENPNPAE
jgi:hypothetical protein